MQRPTRARKTFVFWEHTSLATIIATDICAPAATRLYAARISRRGAHAHVLLGHGIACIAERLSDRAVGVEVHSRGEVPVGIVSARDIVTRIIAPGLDPSVFTAGDIAWSGMARAKVSDGLSHTLELLKATRTSVLPVIDADGSLAGIISMNDVLLALGKV